MQCYSVNLSTVCVSHAKDKELTRKAVQCYSVNLGTVCVSHAKEFVFKSAVWEKRLEMQSHD